MNKYEIIVYLLYSKLINCSINKANNLYFQIKLTKI